MNVIIYFCYIVKANSYIHYIYISAIFFKIRNTLLLLALFLNILIALLNDPSFIFTKLRKTTVGRTTATAFSGLI